VQVLGPEVPADAVGEVDVGCFRLPVGCPGGVGVGLGEIEVVWAGWGCAVPDAGEGDNAGGGGGGCGGEEEGEERVEEEEVGEVVCAELEFEAVEGFAEGGGHYAGGVG
jgi:hypothetical protein